MSTPILSQILMSFRLSRYLPINVVCRVAWKISGTSMLFSFCSLGLALNPTVMMKVFFPFPSEEEMNGMLVGGKG